MWGYWGGKAGGDTLGRGEKAKGMGLGPGSGAEKECGPLGRRTVEMLRVVGYNSRWVLNREGQKLAFVGPTVGREGEE